MTRRELRENVFKIIFQADFHSEDELNQQLDLSLEENAWTPERKEQIREKCLGIFSHREELDAQINDVVEGWKTTRMSKVDLSLIRLALTDFK